MQSASHCLWWRVLLCLFICLPLASCGMSDQLESELKITDGTVIEESGFPAVVWIWMCSATAVSDTTIITASHCAGGQNVTIYDNDAYTTSRRKVALARSLRRFDHPLHRGAYRVGPNDIAVAIFPERTFSSWVSVRLEPALVGDAVKILGYAGAGSFQKKYGRNVIKGIDQMIHLDISQGSISQKGDSGGPMLIDGKLIGNTSGGNSRIHRYTHLARPENLAFLREMVELKGAKIEGLAATSGSN